MTLANHRHSVCVASLIRLITLLQTDFSSIDESWYISDFAMWCTVEANFAIISGICSPLLIAIFPPLILQPAFLFSALSSKLRPPTSPMSIRNPPTRSRDPIKVAPDSAARHTASQQVRAVTVWKRICCQCMKLRYTVASQYVGTKALSR